MPIPRERCKNKLILESVSLNRKSNTDVEYKRVTTCSWDQDSILTIGTECGLTGMMKLGDYCPGCGGLIVEPEW